MNSVEIEPRPYRLETASQVKMRDYWSACSCSAPYFYMGQVKTEKRLYFSCKSCGKVESFPWGADMFAHLNFESTGSIKGIPADQFIVDEARADTEPDISQHLCDRCPRCEDVTWYCSCK